MIHPPNSSISYPSSHLVHQSKSKTLSHLIQFFKKVIRTKIQKTKIIQEKNEKLEKPEKPEPEKTLNNKSLIKYIGGNNNNAEKLEPSSLDELKKVIKNIPTILKNLKTNNSKERKKSKPKQNKLVKKMSKEKKTLKPNKTEEKKVEVKIMM